MKHVTLQLLFVAAIQSLCCAGVTQLPAEFNEVRATSNLPSAILALCDGGGDGRLHDSLNYAH